jgi:hypothetical protein
VIAAAAEPVAVRIQITEHVIDVAVVVAIDQGRDEQQRLGVEEIDRQFDAAPVAVDVVLRGLHVDRLETAVRFTGLGGADVGAEVNRPNAQIGQEAERTGQFIEGLRTEHGVDLDQTAPEKVQLQRPLHLPEAATPIRKQACGHGSPAARRD